MSIDITPTTAPATQATTGFGRVKLVLAGAALALVAVGGGAAMTLGAATPATMTVAPASSTTDAAVPAITTDEAPAAATAEQASTVPATTTEQADTTPAAPRATVATDDTDTREAAPAADDTKANVPAPKDQVVAPQTKESTVASGLQGPPAPTDTPKTTVPVVQAPQGSKTPELTERDKAAVDAERERAAAADETTPAGQ